MEKIRGYVSKVIMACSYVSLAACFVCVFVVAIDVILRKVTSQAVSISGSNELSQYLLVLMCALSIPMFQIKKGHVWVNMFVNMVPAKGRNIWMGIIMAIETIVAFAFTYGCASYAATVMTRHTDILNIPFWPFCYILAFGFLELGVLFLIDCIQFFIDAKNA